MWRLSRVPLCMGQPQKTPEARAGASDRGAELETTTGEGSPVGHWEAKEETLEAEGAARTVRRFPTETSGQHAPLCTRNLEQAPTGCFL